jgi:endonuclease/exonuclease/phosphatase family metal-dependent hydrolase
MRRIVGVALAGALGVSVAVTVARFVDPGFRSPILLASFSVYALPGFAVVLTCCVVMLRGARRRVWVLAGAGLATVGLLVQGWSVAPLFAGGTAGGADHRADLTVMSSNLEFGQGDGATVARVVAEEGVDLLVLVEVTPSALRDLEAAGLDDLLPHRAGRAVEGASGTMVFSRHPLALLEPLELGNGGLELEVQAPESFRLLAVHPAQPVGWPTSWLADMDTVRDRASAAVSAAPTLVVGDFNATRDHKPFRAVLDTGLRDAAEQAGSGWQPTWPARGSWGPLLPLLMIDHVLASDHYETWHTSTVQVPGSDHLALLARLQRASAD